MLRKVERLVEMGNFETRSFKTIHYKTLMIFPTRENVLLRLKDQYRNMTFYICTMNLFSDLHKKYCNHDVVDNMCSNNKRGEKFQKLINSLLHLAERKYKKNIMKPLYLSALYITKGANKTEGPI